MSIIAFNFTKVTGERKGLTNTKHQVQSKTAISDVKEVALGKQKGLSFLFVQETSYEPGIGKIVLEGDVLLLSNDQEAKETVESFKKSKRFAAPLMEKVYNQILQRTSIQSMIMARDLNLPSPIRLPRIATQTSPAKAAPAAAPAKPAAKETPKKK